MFLTANVGAQVPAIDDLLEGVWTPPTENHWEQRLGFVTSYRDDHWWLIAPTAPDRDASAEFALAVTNEGVNAVREKMDLGRLRDHWLSEEFSWASLHERLMFGAVASKLLNESEVAHAALARLMVEAPTVNSPLLEAAVARVASVVEGPSLSRIE